MILQKSSIPPKIGDRKVLTKYAWFPTVMTDGSKIWFEYYREESVWGVGGEWSSPIKTHLPWE